MMAVKGARTTIQWRDTLFFGLAADITAEQEVFLDSIQKNLLTICNARAGTGKTTLAVGMAKLLGRPLMYIFSPVEEKKMGFRKGGQTEKEEAYLQPLKDALIKIGENPAQVVISGDDELGGFALYDFKTRDDTLAKALGGKKTETRAKWVEARSHIFARGTNIEGMTVIIDEAQNWTADELKKVMTRIHDDCRVVLIGHSGQIDLEKPHTSGFTRAINHFEKKDYCQVCTLTKNFRGRLSTDADDL